MTFPTLDVQKEREYWLVFRDALLKQVDAIERLLCISPTTAELRKAAKELRYEQLPKENGYNDR